MQAIIRVFELPPKESCISSVSKCKLKVGYGILEATYLMARPRQMMLSLICMPSLYRRGSTPISLRLSDPARSMKIILPILTSLLRLSIRSIKIEKIKCERLDVSLTSVDRIARLSRPCS